MDQLKCLPILVSTDGPTFNRPNAVGSLMNMRLRPSDTGFYAEARGGFEEMKPSGGTGADAISAGGYSSVHQISTSYGWIRTFNSAAAVGSQYSKNLQLDPGGWLPFATGANNDAVYCGADSPFSRILMIQGTAGSWGAATIVYEYWNGAAWSALTTAETISFPSWGTGYASWTLPTDWAATTVGDAGTGSTLKYWIRIRLNGAVTALVSLPTVTVAIGYWTGMREIYALTQSPRTSATSGTLKRHGQSGTTTEWFSVNTSLFSGHAITTRSTSYRGRLYMVNSKEQKRWDGANFDDIGLAKPSLSSLTVTPAVGAGAGIGAGIWRYYVAFGYGQPTRLEPAAHPWYQPSSYGESEALYIGAEVTTTAGNEVVTITLTGAAAITAGVCTVHLYRTQDLTNVPAGKRADFPAFLVDTLQRAATGTNIATAMELGGVFTDSTGTPNPVWPPVEAVKYSNLPPSRMKYMAVYLNRLFLGDDIFWYWSDPFKPDSFNKTFNYMALTRAGGGRNMGGVEFADQMVLHTEDQTWGLTNVDMDVPHLYPIHPSVGCIAPDATACGDGRLLWLSRDGVYMWDGSGRGLPRKISSEWDVTFGKMSYETHGGSRAVIVDRSYKISLSTPGGTPFSYACFDLDAEQWSIWNPTGFASALAPLAVVNAPLGNSDAGGLHTIWGKVDYSTGAGEYSLMLDELTTLDNGTSYACIAGCYFNQPPGEVFTPTRVRAFYQSSNGWQTPILSGSAGLLSSAGGLGNDSPGTNADYNMLSATFTSVNRGSASIKIAFTALSQAGGDINTQRFFGMLLDGTRMQYRRGSR